jgi:hypothetical protein
MGKIKFLDLTEFQNKLDLFLSIPTYTKQKYVCKNQLNDFLDEHTMEIINVKPNSKYNNCTITHSFTIFKVPNDKLGKLFQYRNKWVLIRCDSSTGGSWGYYWNEVYELKNPVEKMELKCLKEKYKDFFVLKE